MLFVDTYCNIRPIMLLYLLITVILAQYIKIHRFDFVNFVMSLISLFAFHEIVCLFFYLKGVGPRATIY